jgi:hypothetical protein
VTRHEHLVPDAPDLDDDVTGAAGDDLAAYRGDHFVTCSISGFARDTLRLTVSLLAAKPRVARLNL